MSKRVPIMWMVSMDTRHFSFMAFGDTPKDAFHALEIGWLHHCEQCAMPRSLAYIKENMDSLNYTPIYRDSCYCDNEIISYHGRKAYGRKEDNYSPEPV